MANKHTRSLGYPIISVLNIPEWDVPEQGIFIFCGIGKIWYCYKYWNRYWKNLVHEKVSKPVQEKIGIGKSLERKSKSSHPSNQYSMLCYSSCQCTGNQIMSSTFICYFSRNLFLPTILSLPCVLPTTNASSKDTFAFWWITCRKLDL